MRKKKTAAQIKKMRLANLAKARKARVLKKKTKTKPKKVAKKKPAKKLVKRVVKKTQTVKRTPRKSKVVDTTVGFTNDAYKPVQVGRVYALIATDNQIHTKIDGISKAKMKMAFAEEKAIRAYVNKAGNTQWKLVELAEFQSLTNTINDMTCDSVSESFDTHEKLVDFIHKTGESLKPQGLFIEPIKWKYLLRSAVRGRNIMMLGPTGCGKTLAAQSLVHALKRPDFYFNLGSTQDPRAALIGNTHFNKDSGTFFCESTFVKAIKTPNAIILLDEISRAHPEAWNILMTVLDYGQRYLRLDEAEDSPIVKVASGVTFIATANIGNEYTSTRILDRAIRDRFNTIEMGLLDQESEYNLLKFKFPQVDDYYLKALAEIATTSREMVKTDTGKVSTSVSTRVNVEAAGLIYDGFTLQESAEIAILPYFSDEGGLDSERVFMRQLVQKFIKTTDDSLIDPIEELDSAAADIEW